jgi:hypothetical protein
MMDYYELIGQTAVPASLAGDVRDKPRTYGSWRLSRRGLGIGNRIGWRVEGFRRGQPQPVQGFRQAADPITFGRYRKIHPLTLREFALVEADLACIRNTKPTQAWNYRLLTWDVNAVFFHNLVGHNIQPELFENLAFDGGNEILAPADLPAAAFPLARKQRTLGGTFSRQQLPSSVNRPNAGAGNVHFDQVAPILPNRGHAIVFRFPHVVTELYRNQEDW